MCVRGTIEVLGCWVCNFLGLLRSKVLRQLSFGSISEDLEAEEKSCAGSSTAVASESSPTPQLPGHPGEGRSSGQISVMDILHSVKDVYTSPSQQNLSGLPSQHQTLLCTVASKMEREGVMTRGQVASGGHGVFFTGGWVLVDPWERSC